MAWRTEGHTFKAQGPSLRALRAKSERRVRLGHGRGLAHATDPVSRQGNVYAQGVNKALGRGRGCGPRCGRVSVRAARPWPAWSAGGSYSTGNIVGVNAASLDELAAQGCLVLRQDEFLETHVRLNPDSFLRRLLL